MRFIHKWAYVSAKYIQENRNQDHIKRRILYFGFQSVYGDFIKLFLIAIISAVLQSFMATIMLTASFAILRMNAGGFHLNSEGKCIFTSVFLTVIPGKAICTVNSFDKISAIFIYACIFVLSFYCIYKYAPKDCSNNPIEGSNILLFKHNSIKSLIILFSISILFYFFGLPVLALAIIVGILVEVFTITPIGYKIINKVFPQRFYKR